MDTEDGIHFEWEGKICYGNLDDDLDFAIAMSLASEEHKENTNTNSKEKNCFGNIDDDFAFALSLASEESKKLDNTSSKISDVSKPLSVVDEQWELIDPVPDIHALFIEFDKKFFYGKLKCVEVRWSSRMTLCAGICSYQGRGGLCSIGLSVPLLKLRPRRDLVETLLHEMIHAYLFVTENNKDRDGHGPEFLSHMHRINKEAGTKITVYHSFHNEVNLYKQHWWKCEGPCSKRSPFYGLVKRAMNRAPGPNDNWWAAHQSSCGGTFVKIKEPSNYNEKKMQKRKLVSDSKSKPPDIRKFIKVDSPSPSKNEINKSKVFDTEFSTLPGKETSSSRTDTLVPKDSAETPRKKNFVPFFGAGHKLGSSSETSQMPSNFSSINFKDLHLKREKKFNSGSPVKTVPKRDLPSSFSGSAVSKRDLSFYFTGEVPNKKDLPSRSPGKIITAPSSTAAKVPGTPRASRVQNVQKDCDISTYFSSNNSNERNKNAFKEILTPASTSHCNDDFQEINVSGVNFPSTIYPSAPSQVYCPSCSKLIKEEINSHLDKCLQN